ncbi:hypothetical protein MMC24_001845 [Lignoscripta atroalba]|nr:hypothetical protein [Lignoscripta atroalba]
MAAQPHIPAWKKLGLKLKYAKDIPIETRGGAHSISNEKKRKRSTEKDGTAPPAPHSSKKTKKSPVRLEASSTTHRDGQPVSSTITPSPSPTKRKSVSFTPETKTQDGDSIKQLYNAWLAEQKHEDPSFRPEAAGEALISITPKSTSDASTFTQVKESKKSTKSKSTTLQASTPASRDKTKSAQPAIHSVSTSYSSPTLTYLSTYHTSPSAWKFNKSKQTHLLKTLFDTSTIPHSYDDALKAYLTGLQGSAARSRLRDTALAIRKEDEDSNPDNNVDNNNPTKSKSKPINQEEETYSQSPPPNNPMENPARRKENYQHALQRFKSQLKGLEIEREDRERELDPAWQRKLLKRKRAELVLWAIGEEPEAAAEAEAEAESARVPKGSAKVRYINGAVAAKGGVVDGGDDEEGAEINGEAGGEGRGNNSSNNNNNNKRMKFNTSAVAEGSKKRKRKRKNRTGVPDDDSSSSSESSSSSSSSSGSGNGSGSGEDGEDDGDESSSSSNSSPSSSSSSASASSSSSEEGDSEGSQGSGSEAESGDGSDSSCASASESEGGSEEE